MATKQIPFSLEIVKKIQAGEIKGIMRTTGGDAVRFLGKIKSDTYPLIFAREIKCTEEETSEIYTLAGKYNVPYFEHEYDIILEIEDEEKKPEYQFKPFDKVLARNRDSGLWTPDFFSYYIPCEFYKYMCIGGVYSQCIPFEGNEHLLGTTDKPMED